MSWKREQKLDTIPIIEIPKGRSFSPSLVQELGTALTEIGFICVPAPKVSEVLPEFYKASHQTFHLPIKVKKQYENVEIQHERGYTPRFTEIGLLCRKHGSEKKVGKKYHDIKEGWFMGPRLETVSKKVLEDPKFGYFMHENIWPKEVPTFEPAMTNLYDELFPVGQDVLRVLAQYLNKPAGYFDRMLKNGPTLLRAIYYPSLTNKQIERKTIWACGHTDINLVTVLPKSTPMPDAPESGLWIRLRHSGVWIQAKVPDGCVMVQTGDMLKYLTNGFIASAVHEVRAPTHPTMQGRLSAAMFLHPASRTRLGKNKLAGQLVQERLGSIGFKKAA